LHLSSRFEGKSGERTLKGVSCKSVVDAAALTLALMLNPDAAPQQETAPREEAAPPPQGPEASEARPKTPAPRSAAPVADRSSEPAPSAPWPKWGGVFGHGGIRLGALEQPAMELALGGSFGWGPFATWLDASYLPSQRHGLVGQPSAGGRLWVASTGASLGYLGRAGVLHVGPSFGAEFSRLSGRGAGISDPRRGTVYWTSLRLGAEAALPLTTSLKLEGRVQGLLPLARPAVFVEDLGRLQRPARLGLRAAFGASFAW
jgi:hypothetical protein